MTAAAYLAKRDKKLAAVIRRVKLKRFTPERNYFYSLAESIISQQLSVKAADTITKRLIALFPRKRFPTPQDILKLPSPKLRATGVSGAKVKYLKDLARHVADKPGSRSSAKSGRSWRAAELSLPGKRLDFHKFPKWTDEEIIQHLTAVHGIGRWTAEMFLMFSLNRPDVFSVGDQGLKNAIRKLYGFKKEPTAKQMLKLAEVWRPHRTLACRYLWKSLVL